MIINLRSSNNEILLIQLDRERARIASNMLLYFLIIIKNTIRQHTLNN